MKLVEKMPGVCKAVNKATDNVLCFFVDPNKQIQNNVMVGRTHKKQTFGLNSNSSMDIAD